MISISNPDNQESKPCPICVVSKGKVKFTSTEQDKKRENQLHIKNVTPNQFTQPNHKRWNHNRIQVSKSIPDCNSRTKNTQTTEG